MNLTLWALSLQVVPNLSLDERDAERGQKNERQGREWEEGWESTKRDIRFDFLFKFSPAIHDDGGGGDGGDQLIIFRFSIIKKSERIYLDNPIKGLDIFIKY